MEDLVPLLIFIVIAIINLLKYKAEKKGPGKPPAKRPEQTAPRRQPASIEEFFEEIVRKLEPQPRGMPEWPETIERPDYVQEMREFERAKEETFEKTPSLAAPPPPPKPAPTMKREISKPAVAGIQAPRKLAAFKLPVQGAVFSGMGNMRMSMPPLLRSATGRTNFELEGRDKLRQAIIANMVFSPPRAYDTLFDNTIAK